MSMSNRAYTIVVVSLIVLFILCGFLIYKITKHIRVESKNYKVDNNIKDEIDQLIDDRLPCQNLHDENIDHNCILNQIDVNQVDVNTINTNSIETFYTNTVSM